MQRKAILLLVVISGLTTGCVVAPKLSSQLAAELDKPLHCEGAGQCKEMWERAMYFVSTNAAYKIQVANDSLIETYNPDQYSSRLAFKITKEPLGDGKYRIWTRAACANFLGCTPPWQEAVAKAKLYIRTGTLIK